MTLSKDEFDDISKEVVGNIVWEGPSNARAREFRIDVQSEDGHPIFVKGWFNPSAGKLSYSIVHRAVGRIYGLDLGADHRNPDGYLVGEKHKNYWVPGNRDWWAYVPEDITEPWNRPLDVWAQFCAETNMTHSGTMSQPAVQGGLSI